jgi:hypothetical protein
MGRRSRRDAALAAVLDVTAIVVFVALGRRTHDESSGVAGVVGTAAPFLIGAALGWLGGRAWRSPLTVATGAVVCAVTLVVGMVLRRVVFDDGTAWSFVVVATLFLALFLIGWRIVAHRAGAAARN